MIKIIKTPKSIPFSVEATDLLTGYIYTLSGKVNVMHPKEFSKLINAPTLGADGEADWGAAALSKLMDGDIKITDSSGESENATPDDICGNYPFISEALWKIATDAASGKQKLGNYIASQKQPTVA